MLPSPLSTKGSLTGAAFLAASAFFVAANLAFSAGDNFCSSVDASAIFFYRAVEGSSPSNISFKSFPELERVFNISPSFEAEKTFKRDWKSVR